MDGDDYISETVAEEFPIDEIKIISQNKITKKKAQKIYKMLPEYQGYTWR